MSGFAIYPSPFGPIRVDYEGGVVTGLKATGRTEETGVRNELTERVNRQLSEYLAGQRREFDFPFELRGTDFQKAVWRALLDIPYGQTRSYGQIARAVGRPGASRAVGLASGKNPIWIAVPCHRVVGARGALTGYAGGLEMKKALLELERGNSCQPAPGAAAQSSNS